MDVTNQKITTYNPCSSMNLFLSQLFGSCMPHPVNTMKSGNNLYTRWQNYSSAMTGNMNYNPNYPTVSPLLAGGKQLAHGCIHHQNFGKEIVRPMRKLLREKTQADYGLIPLKKSSSQHELQSKVSLLRNRVEVTNQNTASKNHTVFQSIILHKLFLPHSLLTLLQPLETC